MLFTLRYPDELRGISGFELPTEGLKEARVTSKEIELAKRLIDDMTAQWDPADFQDTYQEDLMARIKEKIKKGETKEITEPSSDGDSVPASNVIDLASILQKSIASGGRKARSESKGEASVVSTTGRKPAARRKRA